MGAVIRYDYTDDIKNHRFEKIVGLLRTGKISTFDQTELNLLADYLEGNLKRGKGAPKKDKWLMAEYLYAEFESLKEYGMTTNECCEYIREHATAENHKTLMVQFEANKKNRKDAIAVLAEKEKMSVKNVERLVDIGRYFHLKYMEEKCHGPFE